MWIDANLPQTLFPRNLVKTYGSELRGQEKQPARHLPKVYLHVAIGRVQKTGKQNKTNLSTTPITSLLLTVTSNRFSSL